MNIVAIIPSRYGSTRFPGKPLVMIAGKPMIWWVHHSVQQVNDFKDVYVATDDERISEVCRQCDIKTIMTSPAHMNCFHRVHEVTSKVDADRYVVVNGDEPLIESSCIQTIVDDLKRTNAEFLFSYRRLNDPTELVDSGNIKVVISNNHLVYLSRTPIPYPHKSSLFSYKKIIGIQAFSRKALDFFVNTPPGEIEQIEDIAELRWVENGKNVRCVEVVSDSISVDNPRDIQKVEEILKKRRVEHA